MDHEKILKRADGSSVLIKVSTEATSYGGNIGYSVLIFTRAKGKRKWEGVNTSDNYSYRSLSIEERRKFIEKKQLEAVSEEEILEAKMELWYLIKPQ